ncbi:hypothetical protein J6590_093474 [Homalodisca vitripennis]|nr:hypothetical protein J6590_093474 [Homalodisca vitripennis]
MSLSCPGKWFHHICSQPICIVSNKHVGQQNVLVWIKRYRNSKRTHRSKALQYEYAYHQWRRNNSGNSTVPQSVLLRIATFEPYLRDIKKMPSGSGGKKKKWHLAEAMSFLKPYMGPTNKNTCSNFSRKRLHQDGDVQPHNEDTETEVDNTQLAINTQDVDDSHTEVVSGETVVANDHFESNEEINPRKKRSKSAAEVVAEPISAYFKSITNKKPVEDHPVLLFFKGLVLDVEKLSQTSQRKFKTDILQCLNRLCEHEEMNQLAVGPHPSPQFS